MHDAAATACAFHGTQIEAAEATVVHVVREVDVVRLPRYYEGVHCATISSVPVKSIPLDFADLASAVVVQVRV